MRVFERNGRVNFVDDNNVFVGYDNTQNCCEDFGWLISRERPGTTAEIALIEELTGAEFPGYQFDTTYCGYGDQTLRQENDTSMVSFRLTDGDNNIYVTLYNTQNGYYAHGYDMKLNGTSIHDGEL